MEERSIPSEEKRKQRNIVIAIVLLAVILLAVIIVGLTYAKYIASDSDSDSAQTARWGNIEITEHEVIFENGQYRLTDKEITIKNGTSNSYENIWPGMTIPKDPFIVVSDNVEVTYGLYIKVVEENFPTTVTYDMGEEWTLVRMSSNFNSKTYIYQYAGNINEGKKIYILKDNKLTVGQNFVTGGAEFKLSFSAWIEQTT